MATATHAQKIAGLYAAFFERAPDAAGLAYWEEQFTATATVADLAIEFAAHDVFTSTYGNMTDVQFVEAIYQNVLGAAGDAAGIDYWVAEIKAGGENARAEMVAQFVEDALTIDLAEFTDLTAEELAVAQQRQDTLTNKVEAGLYFTDKFGAQSNVSGEGELTQDPAYLAAQAAISNVTADPASVAAAKGRIDIAVSTDDAVDSLIGQNSELTAALVDLQTKQKAAADAEDALQAEAYDALLGTGTGSDLAVGTGTKTWSQLTATQKEAVVFPEAVVLRNNTEKAVAAAKSASANANADLASARAAESDAELAADVADALAKVNADSAAGGAKELLAKVTTANAKVAAGSDLAVLTGLKTALANFVDAGGKADAELDTGFTVGDLINNVNDALAAPAATLNATLKTEVSGYASADYTLVIAGTEATAAEKALQTAIEGVEARDKAYVDQKAAEDAFIAEPEGAALRAAEKDVSDRNVKIKAADDAAAAVTKAEANLAAVQQAYDAYVAAGEAVEAAEGTIEDLGFELPEVNAGTAFTPDTATGDFAKTQDELFVAELGSNLNIANFAAGDQLFVGTTHQFGGAANATTTPAQMFAAGDQSALEVFFVQAGADAEVRIENKAFANAAANVATSNADITVIELTGVNIADLSFDNGFVSVA